MPQLRCTVRECGSALTRDGEALRCARGHSFDRAREGYWNLLQPQDRRSPRAGDRDEATGARRRWLARGFADGLAGAIASRIDAVSLPDRAVVVDVGCGEGTLTAQLLSSRSFDACGVDLSTNAIRLAARAEPGLTWIVANADRGLPFADASVDLALSIFGRRPSAELGRVLKPTGALLVVVPDEDDLIELREVSKGRALRRDRVGDMLAELGPRFDRKETLRWRSRALHSAAAIEEALAMSYRGARASERERLAAVSERDVTLSAAILTLVPCAGLR